MLQTLRKQTNASNCVMVDLVKREALTGANTTSIDRGVASESWTKISAADAWLPLSAKTTDFDFFGVASLGGALSKFSALYWPQNSGANAFDFNFGLGGPVALGFGVASLAGYEAFAAPNWDGYGADPIRADTLAAARHLIRNLPATFGDPDIAPGADGTIGLE